MRPDAEAERRGPLTDRQVELLMRELGAVSERIREILDLMTRLAAAGGRHA